MHKDASEGRLQLTPRGDVRLHTILCWNKPPQKLVSFNSGWIMLGPHDLQRDPSVHIHGKTAIYP
jgi:hypothetical protein